MQEEFDRIVVVIPSLNPDNKLIQLIHDLKSGGFEHILIVNDGSKQESMSFFEQAKEAGCVVLSHHVNCGKGRALKTAFNQYLNDYPDFLGLITVDADGQHQLSDVQKCARILFEKPSEMILGSRDFSLKNVPDKSRFGNIITRNVFRLLCGVKINDTQTGLRALSNTLIERFLNIKGERYEYEMNMLIECAENGIPLCEVPIETIYIEKNESSHFNPISDSIKIYSLFMKFLLSSISSFLIDIGLFSLFSVLFAFLEETTAIWTATIGARVISSVCNYLLNRHAVFGSEKENTSTIFKYYTLAIGQMMCSAALVSCLVWLTSIDKVIVKIVADGFLFVMSFRIQRGWVFKKKEFLSSLSR